MHAKATYNIQPLNADALDLEVNILVSEVNTLDLEVNTLDPETQKNITEEFISEANKDDDNIIIISSNEDTVLDSLLQKLK
ncbi:21776_t:CDS:2 [Cetraspora pellucida]|uniref:21776_t:CDS:1 n=1 Tax=Cetraspora pellucida TaxID=1433469 RepID=A0A9N9HET8_9GLOM|nr:21776_t:CDS:2 [Cetraspora pellucida]